MDKQQRKGFKPGKAFQNCIDTFLESVPNRRHSEFYRFLDTAYTHGAIDGALEVATKYLVEPDREGDEQVTA